MTPGSGKRWAFPGPLSPEGLRALAYEVLGVELSHEGAADVLRDILAWQRRWQSLEALEIDPMEPVFWEVFEE